MFSIYQRTPRFSVSRILIFKSPQENIQTSFSMMITETEFKVIGFDIH